MSDALGDFTVLFLAARHQGWLEGWCPTSLARPSPGLQEP